MALRDLFTQVEWETLEISVLWIFQAIAGADKKIDIHELDAIAFIQENAHKFDCELLKEVLSSVKYNIEDISDIYKIDNREINTGLRDLAELLSKKVEKHDALLFKKSLLAIGMYIAFASGDVLSSKMSNIESQTLFELSLFMKIPKVEYRKAPTVQELMNKFVI
jgi:hypothetical protein